MNIENFKDFNLYEGKELVATFSKLSLAVSEGSYAYVAEELDINHNFHLLNDSTNKYSITFKAEKEEGLTGNYRLKDCVIDGRTPVTKDYFFVERIYGVFDSIVFEEE